MFENNPFKGITRFHVLLALSTLWIIALVVAMVFQNVPPKSEVDSTLSTFAQIQKKSLTDQSISLLPDLPELNPKKIALGLKLFSDPILSHDNSIACSTCHDLHKGGVDHLPVAVGMNKKQGRRNTPTVFNSGFNFRQFWDGRAFTLEEQIDFPIQNPVEMASSWAEVLQKLNASPYVSEFNKIYGSKKITADKVREVLATFERALVTANSPFDRWLAGEQNALNASQKEGYRLFEFYGCMSCHQGVNIGGNMFEKLGVFRDFYETKQNATQDFGRFEISGEEEDRYEFKVPSLRNVALTAPYLHDGSVETLREVIELMAYHQIGVKLTEPELNALEDFLNALTGKLPAVLKK